VEVILRAAVRFHCLANGEGALADGRNCGFALARLRPNAVSGKLKFHDDSTCGSCTSSARPGTRLRKQKGSRGFEVTSKVVLRFRDGRVEERLYHSGYRPAPEVYWIAPGYDESQLPPLPDHALGVEGRIAVGTMYDDEAAATSYSPMTL
jgi:hypothetical protein